jgi:hypothetical protein
MVVAVQAALVIPTQEVLDIQVRAHRAREIPAVILGTAVVVQIMVVAVVAELARLAVMHHRRMKWAAMAVKESCQQLLVQVYTTQAEVEVAHIIQQFLQQAVLVAAAMAAAILILMAHQELLTPVVVVAELGVVPPLLELLQADLEVLV